jgi:hypothetical protein
VLTYSVEQLPHFDAAFYGGGRAELSKVAELTVPPRDAKAFEVAAGHFFRIMSVEGPQVGDLNLWNAHDLTERFYSGKTRALHATHPSTGDRLWSTFPALRPMATITHASCIGKKLSIRSSSKDILGRAESGDCHEELQRNRRTLVVGVTWYRARRLGFIDDLAGGIHDDRHRFAAFHRFGAGTSRCGRDILHLSVAEAFEPVFDFLVT